MAADKDFTKMEEERTAKDAETCIVIKDKVLDILKTLDENIKQLQYPSGDAFVELRLNVTRLLTGIPNLCENTLAVLRPPQPEMMPMGADQVVMSINEVEQLRAAAAELAELKQT